MASLCSSRSWLPAWSRLAGAHCNTARLTSKNSCSGFARCYPLVNCSRPRHRAGHHAARGGGKPRPRELQLVESGGAGRMTATEAAGRPTVRCRRFPEVEDLCFFLFDPKTNQSSHEQVEESSNRPWRTEPTYVAKYGMTYG